jgi:hypothetical protein
MKGIAGGSGAFGAHDLAQQWFRNAIATADDLEVSPLLAQPFALEAKEGADDPEDALHLLRWPGPVVGRECIEGEHPDAELRRVLDDATNRCDSCAVAGNAGKSTMRRPAAIAIHDDGDMYACL